MADASKKTSKKKAARKKPAKKAAARKTASRKSGAKKKAAPKAAPASRVDRISGSVKKLMLANLGLYGQVLDEMQAQASRASKVIKEARKNPSKVNRQLVKRGEELADQITDILKRSGAPATKQLEKQLADLKKSVDNLRKSLRKA